jgi:hypothetical protein
VAKDEGKVNAARKVVGNLESADSIRIAWPFLKVKKSCFTACELQHPVSLPSGFENIYSGTSGGRFNIHDVGQVLFGTLRFSPDNSANASFSSVVRIWYSRPI